MYRRASIALLDFVMEYDLERGLKPEAARQYRVAVESVNKWAGRPLVADELEPDLFNRWVQHLQAGKNAPATIANRRRHLLTLWRAAADRGMCQDPPRRLRPARVPYTPPRAWTVDEVKRLLEVAGTLRRTRQGKMNRATFWTLAIRIAWESGLRLGDALKLNAADIQPDGMVVMAQSKTSRPVVFRLTEKTRAMIEQSMQGRARAAVLPWPSTREAFRKQFALIVKKAGVRRGTWKWLRRSSATDVERLCPGAGAPHLGHARGSTIAARHYIDPYIVGAPLVAPTPLD